MVLQTLQTLQAEQTRPYINMHLGCRAARSVLALSTMPLHSEAKHYQTVTSATKPWLIRIEKFVAGSLVCEVRNKVTDKVLYSITLTYDESYALREALWWIEHIEPEPSTY